MRFNLRAVAIAARVASGAFALVLAGCSGHDSRGAAVEQWQTAEVRVEVIQARSDAGVFHAVGRVKNTRESTIASKVMGKVFAVHVKAGDIVKEGQPLIAIDDRDVTGQLGQSQGLLAQAEAARVIAKQNLDRMDALRRTKAISDAQYDMAAFDHQRALGSVEQARGALRTAQSYLQETRVVAPFSGRIVDTMIEKGEMASPGYPLVRMEGDGDLEFEATVTSQDIGAMKVGQAVTIELEGERGNPQQIPGVISEIVPAMDRVTHSNIVRVHFEKADNLRSGMFGRASFSRITSACPGVLVNEDRLVRMGQLTGVFVLGADDRVRLRLVREGRRNNGKLEILSGLAAGDRLIVSDTAQLKDGQPAKVVM